MTEQSKEKGISQPGEGEMQILAEQDLEQVNGGVEPALVTAATPLLTEAEKAAAREAEKITHPNNGTYNGASQPAVPENWAKYNK